MKVTQGGFLKKALYFLEVFMDWFEKIKLMSRKELAQFLSEFDVDEITNDYCKNRGCKDRIESGLCKYSHDCPIEDSDIIEKWLLTKDN